MFVVTSFPTFLPRRGGHAGLEEGGRQDHGTYDVCDRVGQRQTRKRPKVQKTGESFAKIIGEKMAKKRDLLGFCQFFQFSRFGGFPLL